MTAPLTRIQLSGVGKTFQVADSPGRKLLGWLGWRSQMRGFTALEDISLDVRAGETVGIIGRNGAGKSTLLKLVTGTLLPTAGSIEVLGRTAALLELGMGFHPDFTGRQNIGINGRLLGLTEEELARLEGEIIAFSELEDFIDQPLRTYSSGMVVRLGFAVASSVSPDVLIVDEALSVGDARFTQKCIRRMKDFRDRGVTSLFVSHDASAVSQLCDRVVVLERGRMVFSGPPREAIEYYGSVLSGSTGQRTRTTTTSTAEPTTRYGTFAAVITSVGLLDDKGTARETFTVGETLRVRVEAVALVPIENLTVGFVLRDALGVDIIGSNTALDNVAIASAKAGERVAVEVAVPLLMASGEYSLTVAIHEDETHVERCYDWADRAARLRVVDSPGKRRAGRLQIPVEWNVARTAESSASDGPTVLEELFAAIDDPLALGDAEPSPFLAGFYAAERTAAGRAFRWAGATATLVVRPHHRRLVLAVGRPPIDGHPIPVLDVSTAEHGNLLSHRLDNPFEVVVVPLPESLIGSVAVLSLRVSTEWLEPREASGAGGRLLGFALYAVQSISDSDEVPAWDVITQRTSTSASTRS